MKPLHTFVLASLCAAALPALASPPAANVRVERNELVIQPLMGCTGINLTVVGPSSFELHKSFQDCELQRVELGNLADGTYAYEAILLLPVAGDEVGNGAKAVSAPVSGGFTVIQGSVPPRALEPLPRPVGHETDDVVVPDDQIVIGHQCVGSTCVNGEVWPVHDSVQKLDGNNTYLLFEDSSTGSFPTADWAIDTNDNNSGGPDYFAIDNVTAATRPFQILGSAPSSSLVVSASGNVGIHTATPSADLTIQDPGLPALRFVQGTNNLNLEVGISQLYVADYTAGLNRQIVNLTTGNIGFGTMAFGFSPTPAFLFTRSDGTARLRVEDLSATTAERTMFQLSNKGKTRFAIENTAVPAIWTFDNNGNFLIAKVGSGIAMTVEGSGNVTIKGVLTQLSDSTQKEGLQPIDGATVLAKLAALPLSTWQYKGDAQRHIGPMAQDFYQSFGFGPDDKHVAPSDLASVGLVAVKALQETLSAKEAQLKALEQQNAALAERLAAIEARLAAIQ